jgi:hypothetical protein
MLNGGGATKASLALRLHSATMAAAVNFMISYQKLRKDWQTLDGDLPFSISLNKAIL